MASKADSFIARLAGKYPAINPIKDENARDAMARDMGIMEIFVGVPIFAAIKLLPK